MIKTVGWSSLFQSNHFTETSVEEIINFTRTADYIQLDVETSGLNPRKDKLYTIQLGTSEIQYVVLWENIRAVEKRALIQSISTSDATFLLHNAKFDYGFLKAQGGTLNKVYDTMLAELVLYNGLRPPVSLRALAKKYLNIELEKDTRNDFLRRNFTYTEASVVYGAKDVEILEPIMHQQLKLADENGLTQLIKLESYCALAYGDMEFEGIRLDIQEWKKLYLKNLKKRRQLEVQICDLLHVDPLFKGLFPSDYQGDLFLPEEETKKTNVNLGSPSQVLPVLQRIDPYVEDTSAQTIEALKGKHELIDKLSQFKKVSKLSTTYGKDFLDLLEDGKVHTSFRQILDTGRISSSSPNMQQLPSFQAFDVKGNPVKDQWGEDVFPFRHAFTPPEGWVFVSADYSSQELCVIATGSEDPVWLEALEKGQDLHSVAAQIVYGKKWTDAAKPDCAYMKSKKKCKCPEHKRLRTNVKAINFGLAYGMGPQKLAATLKIKQSEAEELIKQYFRSFPKIKVFLDALGRFGKRNGFIRTFPPFQRVRHFPGWRKDLKDMKIMGSIERQSKNTPIQGSSADMTKLAIAMIRKEIEARGLPVKMVMTVHDQIDTVCPAEYAEKWAGNLVTLMEKAAKTVLKNELLKSEVSITRRWAK